MKLTIRLFILIIVCLLLAVKQAFSQVSMEWEARYNGEANKNDEANSMAVDIYGNIFVTGWSAGENGKYDFATIKYDPNGVQRWVQRYNGPGNGDDGASCIAVDGAGNSFVTGFSAGNGTGEDFVTIKYDVNGSEQWVQRYNSEGNGQDRALFVSIDSFGNSYVAGYSAGNGTGPDYTTIKYNSEGEQLWIAKYNGPGNGKDKAYSVLLDDLGNVYVTGYSWGNGTDFDITTIKYDENGIQLWVARYNGSANGDDETGKYAMGIDASGSIYVTGGSMGYLTGYDFVTIKYDSAGLQKWVQKYNGPGNSDDMAQSIAVDNSGNVYITGQSFGYGTKFDYCTIKYNTLGETQWIQRYNGENNSYDSPSSIAVDNSGNAYVTGYCRANETGYDYTTMKYNPQGVQDWIHFYDGGVKRDDSAFFIVVDRSNNVYVTGKSSGDGTGEDYVTIKIKNY
jgi:hypothetical protein